MCGVIGIIDKEKPVFERAFYGIKSLQNRGEDACGIATCDQKSIFLKKDLGWVETVFRPGDSDHLRGSMAVCHNRYATQGKKSVDDSQPLCHSDVVMALNGNVVNYFALKEKMIWKGIRLHTTVDTEILLNIFVKEYDKTRNFFASAEKLMKKVRGGYAIVGLVAGKGIFAIRDPNGIRPLVLGKKQDSFMLSSETKALDASGYKFVREIEPGEALFITKRLRMKRQILKKARKTACMFESIYFSNENSRINEKFIRDIRKELGEILADKVRKEKFDFIVPVPDTGRPAAAQLASALKAPCRELIKRNNNIRRTFILPSQKIRDHFVKSKFSLIKGSVKGKRICLVDDSLVRGTTARMLIGMLKSAGAERVVFVSTCPKVICPCFYGINMSTKKELIGSKRSTRMIQSLIGADRLVYSSVQDLRKVLGREICTACLTKKYPVRISLYEKMVLACQRAMQDRFYNIRFERFMSALSSLRIKGICKVRSELDKAKAAKMIHFFKLPYVFAKKRKKYKKGN